ncbi:MAG: (2Fe-2S) ferredoxin domain-containing protein [Marinilabiliaceae bacterium]
MKKPEFHFLVCNSFRVGGEAQGFCNKNGAVELVQYLIEECNDRGMDAVVSTTGCLNVCSQGPVLVVHPHNLWYGKINNDAIDEILDALEEGGVAEDYLISE